jgi:RimJ/RimL family protein N-acetyltransferase
VNFLKSYFDFPDIDPVDDFSFEKFSAENFPQLYLMFENDDSPFTDERFKQYNTALQYANDQEKYGRSSPKHGSQDWLFKWKGEYAGILHLYDRSLETFGENNKRCWIGFAIRPSLRKKGVTRKAISHFLNYIQRAYTEIEYIHAMTLINNVIAGTLLLSSGFQKDTTDRVSKKHNFYLFKRAG